MGDLVKSGSKYSDEQRMAVAVQYAVSGNAKQVAKDTGIPRTTIVGWKGQDWWVDAVEQIRAQNTDKALAKYAQMVDKAQDIALEKLPDASAAQASIIAATATDKARLLQNQPTSIRGESESIGKLVKQFEKLSRDHSNIQNSVVSAQTKNDETDETEEIE